MMIEVVVDVVVHLPALAVIVWLDNECFRPGAYHRTQTPSVHTILVRGSRESSGEGDGQSLIR
jgi:hypothetical protein